MATERKTPGAARPVQRRTRWIGALAVALAATLTTQTLIATLTALAAAPTAYAADGPTDTPEWLEPRGLNVVELVGLVPDEHLAGSILAFTGGGGIVQYVSGQRTGDTVTINASVSPRAAAIPDLTAMNCLGQRALNDSWPLAVPGGEVRIFDGTSDITGQVIGLDYYITGQIQPSRGAQGSRYDQVLGAPVQRTDSGALILPANTGCTIYLAGAYATLSATFVFSAPQIINVEVLGSETFDFRTYIGPGDAGEVSSLAEQMRAFDNRHDKFDLTIPEGADFVWVNYPPTPISPYTGVEVDTNLPRPSSGTYRLARGDQDQSIDHVISQGLPLHAQYLDADFSGGTEYLPRLEPINTLSSPEYFVPTAFAYDPCMRNGGCPDELLNAIHDATMPLTIYYYKVSRLSNDLTRIPLRQVGTEWSAGAAAASVRDAGAPQQMIVQVLLPMIAKPEPPPTPQPENEPKAGCPCGWFDSIGAMLDVTPGLSED